MKMNQKGIAYLLVLILGGIIVTSSIVYYSSTLIESRVSSNSRMAKELFYFAESSIHNATSELIKDPNQTVNYPGNFSMNFTRDITNSTNPDQLFSNVTFKQDGDRINSSVFDKDETRDGKNGKLYNETMQITYDVTSQGYLIKNQRSLLPRKISNKLLIEFFRTRFEPETTYGDFTVNGTSSPLSTSWKGFNYGINSGSTLTFSGSTVVRNGGVYARTNVNLGNAKNQLRIDKGEAYSTGTITGVGKINPVGSKPALNPNQPELFYPTINTDYYRSIADLILTGNITFNSFTDIPTTQSDVKEPNDVIVVFVDGNLRITGTFVNTQPILLVVNGTVTMTGNSNMGSPTIPFGVIATGDINRSTGNAEVNGFYYTPGKIDMKGNFNLRGALVSASGVTLTGNVDITYDKTLAEKLPLILDPYDSGNIPPVTIRVTASPGTIYPPGGSSRITWETNATGLTTDPNIGSSLPNGEKVVTPSGTTTYTFTATGLGGTVTVNITIIVTNNPPSSETPPPSPWVIKSKQFLLDEWKQSITP